LTEDFDPKEKNGQILNLAADYLAAGLGPKKSVIFLQSQVPQSTELAWILSTIAPFGELSRMTQFKEKSGAQKENINVGLFTYPTLMAADILLYDAEVVPVGEDQLQHLELARTLARKFNSKFGETFVEPKALMTATPRLMSLDDPTKKMSKSRPAGCLFIDDSPKEIEQKIKTAVTDSSSEVKYDEQNKPAISNLLMIYSELSGKSVGEIEKKFAGKGYADFKKSLAEIVSEYFADFRNKKAALLKKPAIIKKVLQRGSGQAAKVAQKKIEEVKKKIGITL
jgi:tryptophanyl-tRNA synthetase